MIERCAGDEGEAWLRRKSIGTAYESCDGMVASEGFGDGEGACSTAAAEDEDAHVFDG